MTQCDWFNDARYGMFIHWGPYSVAGRGEWMLNREHVPYDEYTARYVEHFTAAHYDPRAWAKLAREGGMRYMVLTTRHHDGFALWGTDTNGFNAVAMGPKRDLVGEYVEAVRAEGLKVGLYYSVADWHHPDYPGAYHRDWPKTWNDETGRARFVAYYRTQLEELMTRYGKIDMLWYDGCIPSPTDGAEVNTRVKELQPDILINNRNGEPCDFQCCEQAIRPAAPGVDWEACMTLNGNWGYHAGDLDYKSPKDVINLLTEVAAGGGNLLLNVGPTGEGIIPDESARIIREVGAWLERNGEFLPSSTRSPFSWNMFGRLTTKGSTIYVHIFRSTGEELCLAEVKNTVLGARLVATGAPVAFEQRGTRLFLRDLPVPLPDPYVTTIALDVEGEPAPIREQSTFWIPG